MSTLFVIEQAEYSGAETAQAPILLADTDAVVACPPGSKTETWLHSLGVSTLPLPHRTVRSSGGAALALASALRGVRSALDLRGLLRAHPQRTVVIGTSLRPSLFASVAALGLRGRKIVWTVTDKLPPAPIRQAVLVLARLRCDRIVCHSRYIADHLIGHAGWLAKRIEVDPPGVDVRAADGDKAAQVGGGDGNPHAIVLGHVSPTKRTDLAVDIAELVAAELPEFRLDIVGAAQYRDEDRELEASLHERVAADPELARHVNFTGHDPQAMQRLRSAALLLHCRTDEPFGMVLIEAMALGVPVVAPASGGPAEIIRDGETGLLYPPGDTHAAARQVVRLLRDPELAERIKTAAAQEALTRYSNERQIADYRRLLSTLT